MDKDTRDEKDTLLHDIIPCDFKQNLKQLVVDCSRRSLNFTNKFWFPENTTEIMLQLETIIIKNSRLSSSLMSEHSFRVFQKLRDLLHLDISYNSLEKLSPRTFQTNPNLTSLRISGNRFKNIPFDLKLTQRLQVLDIRRNEIKTISKIEMENMETIRTRLGSFHLLLAGNILSCGCENLYFLQWLQQTTIQLDDERNFTCRNKEGVLSFTLAYKDIEGLMRGCNGEYCFNITIALYFFTIIAFMVFFLWTKNKTLITSTCLQIFAGYKLSKISDYKYNTFIGYSEDDHEFAFNTLRQFIERELQYTTFTPNHNLLSGPPQCEGIMEAINSSWRVLLVVNEGFINESDFFYFTIKSALYSVSPVNPYRVVILVKEKYLNILPIEFFSAVPEDNIILVDEWVMTCELEQALRSRLK
ncbi:hypothetical protein Btru_070423 [Bulinus truncatus]|nr:hypothetical protein Btru_070423 [Bulinus truncatus]